MASKEFAGSIKKSTKMARFFEFMQQHFEKVRAILRYLESCFGQILYMNCIGKRNSVISD